MNMITRTRLFVLACGLTLAAGWGYAEDSEPAPAAGEVEGYVQAAPKGYSFSGDQGYLQRYRSLDPANEGALDRALEILDQFGLAIHARQPGAPSLELYHDNQFLLNDRWQGRWSPTGGVRLDFVFHDYQRPFEKYLPAAAPATISYAQRYNDDVRPGDDLRRRRRDLSAGLKVMPAAFSSHWEGLRSLEVETGLSRRSGQRQFMWVFGVVEDLVVPAGNNPARWRGRAEEIDQRVDRLSAAATLSLGEPNLTWVRFWSDRFDNRAPLVTNADIARYEPSVNTSPNTINFIADSQGKGLEAVLEQRLHERLALVLDGGVSQLEQRSLTPFQAAAVYEGKLRFSTLGAALYLEAKETVSVEVFSRWSTRRNDTPVATADVVPRHFLLADRNLSFPFLKRTETQVFGGTARYLSRYAVLRGGARWDESEREFVYGVGSNAIPPGLLGWGERSDPRTVWLSASSRGGARVRWSARWEHRANDHTWSPADPARLQRLRASAGVTSKEALSGLSLAALWEDSENRQFAFSGRASSAAQRWDSQSLTASLFGWHGLAPTWQLFGGLQHTRRDQDSHLLLANVRRWRESWVGEVYDPAFGYESKSTHLTVGSTVALNWRVTLIPSLALTRAEAGIASARVPVREFSAQENRYWQATVLGEYRIDRRSRAFLQYGYHRFEDSVDAGKDGRLHAVAGGYSRSF